MRHAERITAGECRAEGRTLTGVALPYGERSPVHRERFLPGAFRLEDEPGQIRWLNLRHDPLAALAWTHGGGLELTDTPDALHIRAELPPIPAGELAFNGLRDGSLGGLSVEFFATKERRDGDTRVIERADLYGVGVVSRPSYRGATAEVRAEVRAAGIRAKIPFNQNLACDCHAGPDCNAVNFEPRTFDVSLGEAETGEKQVLAIVGSYRNAVAGTTSGTLTIRKTGDGLEIDIPRLPDTDAARNLQEQAAVVPILARPVFRAEPGDYTEIDGPEGKVAHYRKAELRAILLGTSDRLKGWTPAEFEQPRPGGAPDVVLERSARRTVYERSALWR